MAYMLTIAEIRRIKLKALIERYPSIADLNKAIGWETTDTKLGRIKNKTSRGDRGPEKTYNMGDAMAREIEEALDLEEGYFDNLDLVSRETITEEESRVLEGFRSASDEIKTVILNAAGIALAGKKSDNQLTGS